MIAALACFFIAIFAMFKTGIIGNFDTSIHSDEIDLSGTWKIKFADSPEFSRSDLDDSDWCLIAVPQGGDPSSGAGPHDHPAAECPKEAYPREKMRNSTYWYRKEFLIPNERTWVEPALFVGSIKQEGWFYWDGKFIGAGRREASPLIFLLQTSWILPGKHWLAIKTKSHDDMYPGLYHAIPKKISIGSYSSMLSVMAWLRQADFLEPIATMLFQLSALVMILFLVIRSHSANENLFWLVLYFGASTVCASSSLMLGDIKWYSEKSGFIGMSVALVGYGVHIFGSGDIEKSYTKRIVLIYGFFCTLIETIAFFKQRQDWLMAESLDTAVVYGSLIYLIFSSCVWIFRRMHSKLESIYISWEEGMTLGALLFLHFLYAFAYFLGPRFAYFMHLTTLTCLLTLSVLLLAIEGHINQEKRLSFYGRFVRRGLKELLLENESKAINGEKIFKGRKIPIMKVDIVGYTQSTFGMPYGLKRDFQDLWFMHVDRVVAEHIFLDKAQGDGSYYFFDDNIPGGSCSFAVASALRIIEHTVAEFDQAFGQLLHSKMLEIPELRAPMQSFFDIYKKKSEQDFSKRRTRVRIALVYGFVDEGLWGLNSQGHYEVAGDLLSLAARLEPQAGTNEIVVNEMFIEKWREESPESFKRWNINWHEAELKGIGVHRFAAVSKPSPERKLSRDAA